jgi:hypothetical protein
LKQLGKTVSYVGESVAILKKLQKEFAVLANGTSVLFTSARSPRTVQQALSSETKIIDLSVYETVEDRVDQSFADVLDFSRVHQTLKLICLDRNLLNPGQKVVAIGKSNWEKKFDEMNVFLYFTSIIDEVGKLFWNRYVVSRFEYQVSRIRILKSNRPENRKSQLEKWFRKSSSCF